MRYAIVSVMGLTIWMGALPGAKAGTLSAVSVTNSSSADDFTPPGVFQTQSDLSTVTTLGSTTQFSHRMAFHNSFTGGGGAAQVHKRNVIYQVDFTVDDPSGNGFEVNLESLLRGISVITQTSDGGTAFATGANFFVEVDDSTDAPDTFASFVPLFNGTDGVNITGMTSASALSENSESASLGNFVGTTTFAIRFSTVPTPATNILLGNFQTGSGSVIYGLGTVPNEFEVDAADLGHFLTVSVTFVPEPSTAMMSLVALAGWGALAMRRRQVRAKR